MEESSQDNKFEVDITIVEDDTSVASQDTIMSNQTYQKRLRTPRVFGYFYLLDANNPEKQHSLRAVCRTCDTTICYSKRATSNLITHLRRKHPPIYAEYVGLPQQYYLNDSFASTARDEQSPDSYEESAFFQLPDAGYQQQTPQLSEPSQRLEYQNMDPQTAYPYHNQTFRQPHVIPSSPMQAESNSTPNIISMRGRQHPFFAAPKQGLQHSPNPFPSTAGKSMSNTIPISPNSNSCPDSSESIQDLHKNEFPKPRETTKVNISGTDSMINIFVHKVCPPTVLNDPHFFTFVKTLNPSFNLPTEQILSQVLIPQKIEQVKSRIISSLENASKVCLIITKWYKESGQAVLTINCQHLEKWELRNHLLACEKFEGLQKDGEPSKLVEAVISEFKIADKVEAIISEEQNVDLTNVSFSLPGYCNSGLHPSNDTDALEVDAGVKLPFTPVTESTYIIFFQELSRCIRAVIKNSKLEDAISKVLSSEVTQAKNEATGYASNMKIKETPGWSNQLKCLRKIIRKEKEQENDASSGINQSDLKVISELCDVLEPFEEAIDYLSNSNTPMVPASFVIPCIRGLQNHLSILDTTGIHQHFLNKMKVAFSTVMTQFEFNSKFQLAAVLDPRFKSVWCNPDEVEALKTSIIKQVANSNGDLQKQEIFPQAKKQKTTATQSSKLFSLMNKTSQPEASDSSCLEEVENYLSLPCINNNTDPLLYWKTHAEEFPNLSSIASSMLCIPAVRNYPQCPSLAMTDTDFIDIDSELWKSLTFIRKNDST